MSAQSRDLLTISTVVIVCLLPFLAKPFHIDDPMYIWAAQQIVASPFDFYGFDVNWTGISAPMYMVNKNPPLVSYYLAIFGALLGFGEVVMHLAMIGPAVALALGTYKLARRLCASPLVSTLFTWATPLVLVASTTVMSDVLMLALWVWAAVFWMSGVESGHPRELALAGLLMGVCALAKYFGVALVPLAFVYALAETRRLGRWVFYLLLPLALVGGYELYMVWHYGWDPLGDASVFAVASDTRGDFTMADRALFGLSFAGGGLITSLFFVSRLWSRRVLVGGAVVLVAAIALLPQLGNIERATLVDASDVPWGLAVQLALFAGVGVQLLALAAADLSRRRDATALFLSLWVGGVWVFLSFVNWVPTARAALPMAPAVGILLVRRLEDGRAGASLDGERWCRASVLAGLVIALAVGYGDVGFAQSARMAAKSIALRYGGQGRLYFQGAWGFQHYMEAAGATRIDFKGGGSLRAGDHLAWPVIGSNIMEPPRSAVRLVEIVQFPVVRWVGTMSQKLGASFYAAGIGPLPFAFGSNPPERYHVLEVTEDIQLQ
jgi:4-amino-4-deoxy-L-arabinose transferase-like glycosyltransferase